MSQVQNPAPADTSVDPFLAVERFDVYRVARGGTTDLAEWSLKELKRLATENRLRPPSSVWEPVFGDDQAAVGKLADHLLHSKRAPVPLSENDALRCIQASIDLLEALFSA